MVPAEDYLMVNELLQLRARVEYLERELKAVMEDLQAAEQDYLAACADRDDAIDARIAAELDKEELIAALSK